MNKLLITLCMLSLITFIFSCEEIPSSNTIGIPVITNNDNHKSGGSLLSDETMTLAPYKLILNADGKDQTMQIIFGGSMPSGYSISDYDINLYFGKELICKAIDFRYCYVDNNYLGEFDRTEIQENSYVKSLAGTTVKVTASGTYTLRNDEDNEIVVSFSKYAYCEIVKPGKK